MTDKHTPLPWKTGGSYYWTLNDEEPKWNIYAGYEDKRAGTHPRLGGTQPLLICTVHTGGNDDLDDFEGMEIEELEANAKLIVEAVNNHHRLKEENERLKKRCVVLRRFVNYVLINSGMSPIVATDDKQPPPGAFHTKEALVDRMIEFNTKARRYGNFTKPKKLL